MPDIRIMNWNIQQLSVNKLAIPGMATALARTVAAANVDILIVLEVKMSQVGGVMTAFSEALRLAQGGGNNWRGYFLSRLTGGEYYCVFIRNLNLIRPLFPRVDVGPSGGADAPLVDLRQNQFQAWPTWNWGTNAYPVAPPYPRFPLCDLFAAPDRPRGNEPVRFGGQTPATGGYSLGRGYRLPTLALFWIHTPGGGDYFIPVVMCHYAAVRSLSQRNTLAQGQIFQLQYLHIAQMFNSNAPAVNPPPGQSFYLDRYDPAAVIPHTAVRVQEICFTGDFNVNFLENSSAPAASPLAELNRKGFNGITPTQQQGGSAGPPAGLPATPGAAAPLPALPYVAPWPLPPGVSDINPQRLRAAVTTQGTIMYRFPPPVPPPVPPPPAPYVSGALDNFFYGGTRLNTAQPGFGVNNVDSGQVINVPLNIVQPGGALVAGQINLAPVAQHYFNAGTKNAPDAPNLQAPAGAPGSALTNNDRLIGARLLSDHLPVVLQFNCP